MVPAGQRSADTCTQRATDARGGKCKLPAVYVDTIHHPTPRGSNANGLNGTFVEIGVRHGDYSIFNLHHWEGATYVMIDPRPSTRRKEVAQYFRNRSRGIEELEATDEKVVDRFLDGSIDIVYIDASHHLGPQREYISRWWPKVRPGGILAGDDYVVSMASLRQLHRRHRMLGPWVGMCASDGCQECEEQCRVWRLSDKEQHTTSMVVRAVTEFARKIRQPVGVALSGRLPSEAALMPQSLPTEPGAGPAASNGKYWEACDFDCCYLQGGPNPGEYRTVPRGRRYFKNPNFYLVKPLASPRPGHF